MCTQPKAQWACETLIQMMPDVPVEFWFQLFRKICEISGGFTPRYEHFWNTHRNNRSMDVFIQCFPRDAMDDAKEFFGRQPPLEQINLIREMAEKIRSDSDNMRDEAERLATRATQLLDIADKVDNSLK